MPTRRYRLVYRSLHPSAVRATAAKPKQQIVTRTIKQRADNQSGFWSWGGGLFSSLLLTAVKEIWRTLIRTEPQRRNLHFKNIKANVSFCFLVKRHVHHEPWFIPVDLWTCSSAYSPCTSRVVNPSRRWSSRRIIFDLSEKSNTVCFRLYQNNPLPLISDGSFLHAIVGWKLAENPHQMK